MSLDHARCKKCNVIIGLPKGVLGVPVLTPMSGTSQQNPLLIEEAYCIKCFRTL